MRLRPRGLITAALALLFAAMATGPAAARPAPAQIAPLGPDFLWGVASSGFQSEGHAPDSNWSRYVAEGKTADPYRDSVDFFDRYRSDIELARQLGVRVYRIGIEWARVQPQPGVWSEDGLRFYDEVISAITAAGMRPMLTLDHWVYRAGRSIAAAGAIRAWWTTGWPTRAPWSTGMLGTTRCG